MYIRQRLSMEVASCMNRNQLETDKFTYVHLQGLPQLEHEHVLLWIKEGL